MKRIRIVLGLFSVITLFFSCKKDTPTEPPPPPPPYVRTIGLSVVDSGLTYAYLRVRFLDTVQTRAFRLRRDGLPMLTVPVAPLDTILVQDSLALHHTYTYRAYRLRDTTVIDSSLSVTLTTLDTTSHDFVFQTFQLGEAYSSVFSDVAVIDENNIWAVGEVYLRDSTGANDPIPYNAAHWDGTRWNLLRVMFPDCDPNGNEVGTGPHPAMCIFALATNNIWIASSVSLVHWNGQDFQRICLPFGYGEWGFTKIFGWENKLYLVGYNGFIAYYNGTGWQRIVSGTTLAIYDVFGVKDPRTGQYEILCVASVHGQLVGRKILKIQGSTVTEIPSSGLPWSIDEIWFTPDRRYIVVGDGMYEVNRLGDVWSRNTMLPLLYKEAIDGDGMNDVVVGGAFWLLAHYNGVTWRTYFPVASGGFTSVTIRGNLIAAVGLVGNRALVVLGRR